jgi:quinol monooxygenase YgiN
VFYRAPVTRATTGARPPGGVSGSLASPTLAVPAKPRGSAAYAPSVAPIAVFTRLEATPGRREELQAAFESLHEAVTLEPSTAVFAMHEATEEPDVVLFYELYDDDRALAIHRDSPAVRDVVAQLGGLLARPPEVTYARPARAKGLPFA